MTLQTEWTIDAYLKLIVDERVFIEEVECQVTIAAREDGCGDWYMTVERVDTENHKWEFSDTLEDSLSSRIGAALFREAAKDECVKAEWRELLAESLRASE